KDLYSLLETVLKFRGFVMARQEGNIVTIVPEAQALTVDPELVDLDTRTLQAGDMIVTRVFELHYVDVASVTNLLQNMKLSVAVSPIKETQTLFVTCYAHRMDRIEKLVNMVDRLGRTKEFRFRQLNYTVAGTLTQKILALANELQSIPITIALEEKGPSTTVSLSSQRTRRPGSPQEKQPAAGHAVYLDTDERTNSVLMIGYNEQLATVEGLIDVLDVPQQDLRIPKAYDVKHMEAQEALQKLQELNAIGRSDVSVRQSRKVASSTSSAKASITQNAELAEESRVVVLEATNQLLINANQEQHARIHEFLGYIDVSPEDPRTLKIYKIEHVEAEEVTKKLEELGIIGAGLKSPTRIAAPNTTAPTTTTVTGITAEALVEEPQIVVIEQANSLMVNATTDQHSYIATIIGYLDCKMEEKPYQFYPLQNQSPVHLAEVLRNLIQETVQDKEDKIENAVQREEEIKLVPDPNTFSLIVYASKKNQEWIADLIEKLDKRRPQVLIDVALVEVSRTDEFDLDLQLATKWPRLQTGEEMSVVGSIVTPFVGGTGEAFSSPKTGTAQGFYSDAHIQALLTAIQAKSYGRVLAKPKILVNDGQPGTIKTVDTTSVKIESIIIPEEGTQRTTTDFKEYEAGITLTITPNISEGDLLLLQVELDRTDFLQRPDTSVPPDTTASNINTIVTVPDGRTIILGGLLKLNQTKGGAKVPLLGDIPLLGGFFRSTSNTDDESRLYVFLKANILRPDETAMGLPELEKISDKNRAAFETFEEKFQKYEDWPGIKSRPMDPSQVLAVE
ncbi:MAG: secretin N-terminal domain-containing protein, partial [Planctomycetota bacterium]